LDITGIICEYNPFHLGHQKQIQHIKAAKPDGGIVCLMSGNYVQRGAPAIVDKSIRARAAVECGADLVLELPVTASLSSAEGFAQEGVRILGGFCSALCFGAETADKDNLLSTAKALLSAQFSDALHRELDKGLSFPAARQAALQAMGLKGDTLTLPNDILATEYCKAIVQQGLALEPMPISREGSYHDKKADGQNPSATAVRELMLEQGAYNAYIPEGVYDSFAHASLHSLSAGEQAILYRLRAMTDEEFEALPYGSEGLWRKLMQNARAYTTLEEILTATKSKRYTRTRLDRMVMCAFLGITEKDISAPAPYARVLAFNSKGREILKKARQTGLFPNAGEAVDHPYQEMEDRVGRLYSLFCLSAGEAPFHEGDRRIFYKSD